MLVSEIQGNHSLEPKTILQQVSKMFAKCSIFFSQTTNEQYAKTNSNYNKCEKKHKQK